MKRLLYFFLMITGWNTSAAVTTHQDSLMQLAQTTHDVNLKVSTYRNLADIFSEKPQERSYLKLMYQAAQKAKNKEAILDALADIAYTHITDGNIDSVYHCMDLIKKEASKEELCSYLSHIRIKLFNARIDKGKEESNAAFIYEMNQLKNEDKNNIYIQIENAYIIGSSLYKEKKHEEAISYLEKAYKLANTLTAKEDMKYRTTTGWTYANNLMKTQKKEESIKQLEIILALYESNLKNKYSKHRPYFPITRYYLHCYASLLSQIQYLSKEKADYYINEVKKLADTVTEPFDKYNCFLSINNYYLFIEDYPHALQTNDSLIKLATLLAPAHTASLHNLQSKICEKMGNYKLALEYHHQYVHLKDSLSSQSAQEQLNKLQVEYEVDKLKFEKTDLENRSRKIQIIALFIFLLGTIIACIYLYLHWKREKLMKLNLFKLNQKAEESEKMKTEFLNSMCHEIRTPLNAIVGFSDIIVDDAFDNESKKEFCELISTNTVLLTSLIDHLLVVANLDSSNETLPCQMTNINDICREEIIKVSERTKKPLEHQMELPEEDIIIPTNSKYLALVVENLLSNAYKFTQKGKVTLKLCTQDNRVRIEVTDTGCGIPLDKQELVFERFMKLDSFTQGNGLGLFLSRLIITRLAGTIQIDPSYTDGARFIISLPMEME